MDKRYGRWDLNARFSTIHPSIWHSGDKTHGKTFLAVGTVNWLGHVLHPSLMPHFVKLGVWICRPAKEAGDSLRSTFEGHGESDDNCENQNTESHNDILLLVLYPRRKVCYIWESITNSIKAANLGLRVSGRGAWSCRPSLYLQCVFPRERELWSKYFEISVAIVKPKGPPSCFMPVFLFDTTSTWKSCF